MRKDILAFNMILFIIVFFFPVFIMGVEKDSAKAKFIKLNSIEAITYQGISRVRPMGYKTFYYSDRLNEFSPRYAYSFSLLADFQLTHKQLSLESGITFSQLGLKETEIILKSSETVNYTNEYSHYIGIPIVLKLKLNQFIIGGGINIDFFLNRKINLNGVNSYSDIPFQDGNVQAKNITFGGLVYVGYNFPINDNISINTKALLSLKIGPNYAFFGGGIGFVKHFKG